MTKDIDSVAKRCGVHVNTVRNWIKAGKLKVDTFGNVDLGRGSLGDEVLHFLTEVNKAMRNYRPHFEAQGSRVWIEIVDKDTDPPVPTSHDGILIRCANLLMEMHPELYRLKLCEHCKDLFWDDSANRVKLICGRKKCIRKRAAIAAKEFRNRKILQEEIRSRKAE